MKITNDYDRIRPYKGTEGRCPIGYSTEFRGRFVTDKPLPADLVAKLKANASKRHGGNLYPDRGAPSLYCHWVPSLDGCGIEWDGGEKFYEYEAWLELIIDRFLRPAGITLSGTVQYFGDRRDDDGMLEVCNGHVVKKAR